MQNFIEIQRKHESAGSFLRFWRKHNRMSQMDLALEVGISTKHLSFVETGRSTPSRSLVLDMAQSLKLPLRYRNSFLKAAGYASEFGEEPFNGKKMEIVRQSLQPDGMLKVTWNLCGGMMDKTLISYLLIPDPY